MIKLFSSMVLVFFVFGLPQKAFCENPASSPRFVVHLLDYLAKDYSGAVQNGKILSKSEYQEQVEFSNAIENSIKQIPELNSDVELVTNIDNLQKLILNKASDAEVSKLARDIQASVLKKTNIEITPTTWPILKVGKELFVQNCTACHGANGKGDGPGGRSLDPKPTDFLNKDWGKSSNPFQSFNVIRLGVPGTGMAAFPTLTDAEVWNLAFYVNSLRWEKSEKIKMSDFDYSKREWLSKVANLSDDKLKEELGKNANGVIAFLRTYSGGDSHAEQLTIASTYLQESVNLYRSGEKNEARQKALQAYLEGIEPIEAKLRANDPDGVVRIETKMGAVRGAIENKASTEEVDQLAKIAQEEIKNIQDLFVSKPLTPFLSFIAAFSILLREGFEAVLIILALLGVVRAAESEKAEKWVHGGWIVALGLGVVTWFFSGWLIGISGASRELMEGGISIFAVFVLLYVGFWLHRQTEIGRWTKFITVKVKSMLDGNKLIGLAVISFMAVFREAFETVLFIRALWLDAGDSGRFSILMGVLSSLVLIFILSWLALRASKKLPLRKLFSLSSVVMAALATILTGKGLHSLQEAGVLGVTNYKIPFRSDLLGFYPTLETAVPQIIVLILVIVVLNLDSLKKIKP